MGDFWKIVKKQSFLIFSKFFQKIESREEDVLLLL